MLGSFPSETLSSAESLLPAIHHPQLVLYFPPVLQKDLHLSCHAGPPTMSILNVNISTEPDTVQHRCFVDPDVPVL